MKTQEQKLEEFIDTLGLRYFKGKEFTPYWSRTRGSVKNSCPPEHLWPNIVQTIIVLDEVRHVAGRPITLSSTYRNPQYNRAVGGEQNSFHMRFMAIDFQGGLGPKSNRDIVRNLRGDMFVNTHTGAVFEFSGGIGLYDTFVHVDTRGYDANW